MSEFEAKNYYNQAKEFYKNNDFNKSIEYYNKALTIYFQINKISLNVAACYNQIGEVYNDQCDLDKALDYYNKSLHIYQKISPNSVNVATSYNNIGLVYNSKGDLDKALDYYNKSLDIYLQISPNSLNVATLYNNIGEVHRVKGDIDKPLDYYDRSLDIYQQLSPNSLNVAISYNNIGLVYNSKGDLHKALDYYNKSLDIYLQISPNSLNVATSYNNIGLVCKSKGDLDKALDYYYKSLDIRQQLSPNSLNVATSYNNIGLVYYSKGDLDKALDYYNKSLDIYQQISPNSLNIATSYNNIGLVYKSKGDLDQALDYYNKSLDINQQLSPNSLNVALSYYNIGRLHFDLLNYDESFLFFEKSYSIRSSKILLIHPHLLDSAYYTSLCAYHLNKYNEAIKYADITISLNNKYKYAYLVKGQSYEKLNDLNEALKWYDQALSIDPTYGDVIVRRLEVLVVVAKNAKNVYNKAIEDIEIAKQIKRSDFDEKLKEELQLIDKDAKIELPKSKYIAGDPKFIFILQEILSTLQKQGEKINILDNEIYSHKEKLNVHDIKIQQQHDFLTSLSSRMDIIEIKVYDLQHSLDILESYGQKIAEKIDFYCSNDNNQNNEILQQLISDQKRIERNKSIVRELNKNSDLRQYYNSLLSEITAIYITVQVIGSSKVDKSSSNYSRASSYLSNIVSLLPIIGNVASNIITNVGSVADSYHNAIEEKSLLRIRNIASTVEDFDRIAIELSILYTNSNRTFIESLAGKVILSNWKDYLPSVYNADIQGLLTTYIEDNESQASLLGRVKGQEIILYIQEETVSENLNNRDFNEIAILIFDELNNRQNQLIDNNMTNQGLQENPEWNCFISFNSISDFITQLFKNP